MIAGEKSLKMRMRDMETAFKYRRIPYPKRSVELIALLAISCTFFLFMHTNKLNSRLKEMEMKLQPSEFSALGLTGSNHLDAPKNDDINSLHGTYQYLKSTGQRLKISGRRSIVSTEEDSEQKCSHNKNVANVQHDSGVTQFSTEAKPEDKNITGYLDSDKEDFEEKKEENEDQLKISADALNNTKKAQIQDVVVFNRVPKVGSQSLITLMLQLAETNNFRHTRNAEKGEESILLTPNDQKILINSIYSDLSPHIYSQHFAYINFTKLHMPKPIYINLVRDPVERIISWHYYIRTEWYYKDFKSILGDKAPKRPPDEFMNMDFDTCLQSQNVHCTFNQMEIMGSSNDHRRQTLFFCGQNIQLCMPFNSKAAMQKAKRTVEEEYAVVGSWEDTNITLTVFEHYIPRFFRHAKELYHLRKNQFNNVNKNESKRPVSDISKQILRKNLTHEIEFYEFCKQRLHLQYAAIYSKHVDDDDHKMITSRPFNMPMPLELAKRVVEMEYAVVGTWEDTNVTLTVLENYVPRYFKGATMLYHSGLSNNLQNSNPFKPHFSAELKQMVRQNFTREIEFYQFCRQRLHKQYLALKKDELKAFIKKQDQEQANKKSLLTKIFIK